MLDEDAPLQITVTASGRESLVYRSLLRQAIPMLKNPQQFGKAACSQLVQTISAVLNEGCVEEVEDFEGEDNDV